MTTLKKDPSAVLDYTFNWAQFSNPPSNGRGGTISTEDLTDWLASGETITDQTVTVETGLTEDSSGLVNTSTGVRVWLSGGTAGESYTVACSITTSQGRTDERTLTIEVEQR